MVDKVVLFCMMYTHDVFFYVYTRGGVETSNGVFLLPNHLERLLYGSVTEWYSIILHATRLKDVSRHSVNKGQR